jgi:hypothetical protein
MDLLSTILIEVFLQPVELPLVVVQAQQVVPLVLQVVQAVPVVQAVQLVPVVLQAVPVALVVPLVPVAQQVGLIRLCHYR